MKIKALCGNFILLALTATMRSYVGDKDFDTSKIGTLVRFPPGLTHSDEKRLSLNVLPR